MFIHKNKAKTELKRSAVADVSGKSRLSEVRTSSGMFIRKNKIGDCGLSTVREHTMVSGGVDGPGKGVLKRPGLQKSTTNHHYAGSVTQTQATHVASDVPSTFFSIPAASEKASLGGKASLQPKRTPMTQEEINAIMSSDVSMKIKGHCKMDYSRSRPGKGVLKRPGLNSSTNHRSQPIHKGDGSLRLQDEDSPVRERAKHFSHNPSFRRGGSNKRTRNEDLEDHLEVNSPLTDIHTNDPQSEEHIGSTSNGTTVTRKETRALSAAKKSRLNNRKLAFEVDDCAGRIVGDDSQIFITKGGCLVRERAKFDGTTWRKQELSLKTDIISKCVENSSFNGNCKSMVHAIDTQLASQHKSRRWRLHNHYKTYPTKEQAIMNPPRGVKVPDWVLLCERFASEDFQKISTRNKLNRSKNEIPPANGTKSMARVIHMKTKQGEKVTAIGGFKICHFSTKKNGMINDKADEILHDLENEEANSSSTPAEICMEKLGYIPGHLKGRSASKRVILANESLQRELQLEKEKTKKLQIHTNKIEKKHNNLKQKVDYLMKHLPHLSGWQSQMEDHLIERTDEPVAPQEVVVPKASSSRAVGAANDTKEGEEYDVSNEEEPLIQSIECRICQEEDSVKNLEVPCACSGSLKYAHRKCVQRWCNEKRDTICEICHQAYKPGYTAPPPQSDETVIDISGNWTLAGTPLDLNDPRVLAMAAAERRLLETDYDEYEDNSASGASLCRSVAIILMALLLLRHALTIGDGDSDDDDDPTTFFALFMLRAAGFLLPCYIMLWGISILQRRRQAQEVETLAASDVAFMIQAGQHRGLQVTIAPGPAPAPSMSSTPTPTATQVPVVIPSTHQPLQ